MIDYQRIYHIGIRVADLKIAMSELTRGLGLSWCVPGHSAAQSIWTPQRGLEHVEVHFASSAGPGPQHIELLQGPAGSFWDGRDQPGAHHIGIWTDDLLGETRGLVDSGWAIAASELPPNDGLGRWTYFRAPGSGAIVELISSEIRPFYEARRMAAVQSLE